MDSVLYCSLAYIAAAYRSTILDGLRRRGWRIATSIRLEGETTQEAVRDRTEEEPLATGVVVYARQTALCSILNGDAMMVDACAIRLSVTPIS